MIYDLQKASILKRISAFLLDFILLVILATGFAALIAVIVDFGGKVDKIQELDKIICEEYGIGNYLDLEDGESPSLVDAKQMFNELTKEQQERVDEAMVAYAERSKNVEGLTGNGLFSDYTQLFGYTCMFVSLGFFFSNLILEFLVPLLFKHGRTVGKKIFSVGVMQITGVRIKPIVLFVRAMLGKYAIETMVPIALVTMLIFMGSIWPLIVFVAFFILQLVLVIATKNNALIHDIISSTVAVDMQTQMIFDSIDEMMEYKQEVARQEAELAEYK